MSLPDPTAGTDVASLVHRLATCPEDLLAAPHVGSSGVVSVAAVLGDVLRGLGAEITDDWIAATAPELATAAEERWLRAVLVTSWLAADPALAGTVTPMALLQLMAGDLRGVTDLVTAEDMVRDPDRREELARLLLRAAGVTPAGETPERAVDRLATLDTVSRIRVESEARAAEDRARQVREAQARQRAEEAAARASRE